jgi:hypothetical protein
MRGLNHPRYGGDPDPYEYEKAIVFSLRGSEETAPNSDGPGDEHDDDDLKPVDPETDRSSG